MGGMAVSVRMPPCRLKTIGACVYETFSIGFVERKETRNENDGIE